MTDCYSWSGGQEFLLRFGPANAPQIVLIPPLFEEANRTRHLIVSVMRRLSEAGFGTALPDLPGTGESSIPISNVNLSDWEAAITAASDFVRKATGQPILAASFRGGSLFDAAIGAKQNWRLSPETGARIVRDLQRTRSTKQGEVLAEGTVDLAGHRFNANFLENLEKRTPSLAISYRTVRLKTEVADCDIKIDGGPLWRRSEPGDDQVLEDAIVADISVWARQCVS